MPIQFPNIDNEITEVDFDLLDESQPSSEIILREYFDGLIIISGGQIKFWNGSSYVSKPIKYWNGSAWIIKPLKYWNGSAWITTNY